MKKQLIGSLVLVLMVGSAAAQIDKKAAYFKKFDTDGDGKLNQAEFTAMTKKQFELKEKKGYEVEAVKRFNNKDTDKDGFISLEEYKASIEKQKKPKKEA